jgi:hypothetical protein
MNSFSKNADRAYLRSQKNESEIRVHNDASVARLPFDRSRIETTTRVLIG